MNIKIYGKPNCIYCERAKKALDAHGYAYNYFQLGVDYTVEDFQAMFPGRRTAPQIYIGNKLLDDGYTSLVEELENMNGGFADDFA